MKAASDIRTAQVFELKDGIIAKAAALALARIILDYAAQHPDETEALKENTEVYAQ